MSSLVDVRRRHERRKSAGARLQSRSQSASLAPPSNSLTASLEAVERQHRADSGIPELHERSPRKRVKSAIETRREQEASDIFHQQEKPARAVDPNWGVTKYSEDFGPKPRVTLVLMRPASSTRRNNPHPSKAFMTWQYPVRIHEHRKAVPPPPDTWRYIHEGFYEDYTDNYNTGDAKNEVPITNLAKIEFPGSLKKKSPTADTSTAQLLGGVSGTKAHIVPRQGDITMEPRKNFRPASPQTRMIKGTVKDSSLPVVKEWLKVATSKERDLLLQMLQASYDNSENVRLDKALGNVLQPESAEKVQDWLQNASESERQIVLHVLETLAIATDENNAFQMNGIGNHYRAYSYPITLRPRKSTMHSHQSKSYRGQYSKHHHKHKKQSESQSGVFDGRNLGLLGKKMTIQSSRDSKGISKSLQTSSNELKPDIWHNRILKKHTGASFMHAGGVFGQPQKDRGQHFSLHPEWPTA